MWVALERPGYLGKHRQEKYLEWDARFGENKWRLIWLWGHQILKFGEVCLVYERAYLEYLKANVDILNQLITTASNVYDDAPSNINSGFDYMIQETERTHIQDISIRRVVKKLGRKFSGDRLIRIRHDKGEQPLSMLLSPGTVPFHKPDKILQPWLTGWWNQSTVECFYQSNRVLQVLK